MVLSADDLGIRKGLDPIFCSDCGCRIGWAEDSDQCNLGYMFCEDCSKKPKKEED